MKIIADSESWVLAGSNDVRIKYRKYRFRSEIDVQTFVTLPKFQPNFKSSECHTKLIITRRD
jgi:hypothetical protein